MTFIKHGDANPIEVLYKTSETDEEAREKLEKLKEEASKKSPDSKKDEAN